MRSFARVLVTAISLSVEMKRCLLLKGCLNMRNPMFIPIARVTQRRKSVKVNGKKCMDIIIFMFFVSLILEPIKPINDSDLQVDIDCADDDSEDDEGSYS